MEDAAGIKDLVVGFFSKLFAPAQAAINVSLPCFFPSVTDGEIASLVKKIDFLEVKDNVFGIGGLKAPGVDGFPACFYQHQWDLCAPDIYTMVCEAFQKSSFPMELNATLITLVPKVENPHSMVQFRPISLCCTLYKVISKILVSRLRTILPNLISPNQVVLCQAAI